MANSTPVLFLIFNRPEQTRRIFEAIRRYKPEQLFVAADGPRAEVDGEAKLCLEAREVLQLIDWDCRVETLFREENLGCRIAVSSAIDWFFDYVEAGTILEDDCLPSMSFFHYAAELLANYREHPDVMMISGNNFHGSRPGSVDGYHFTRVPHIWGWATWRRAWQCYDIEMSDLPDFLHSGSLANISTDMDVQDYWAKCFIKAYDRKINTWDYQWAFAIFRHQGLCICPDKNLVQNIGFDVNATHTCTPPPNLVDLEANDLTISAHHKEVLADRDSDAAEYQLMDLRLESIGNPIVRWWKLGKKRRKEKRIKRVFLEKHQPEKVES